MNASKNKDSGEVIKNYHQQAFEYISRALRIDEDDAGLGIFLPGGVIDLVLTNKPPSGGRREGTGGAVVQEGDR